MLAARIGGDHTWYSRGEKRALHLVPALLGVVRDSGPVEQPAGATARQSHLAVSTS